MFIRYTRVVRFIPIALGKIYGEHCSVTLKFNPLGSGSAVTNLFLVVLISSAAFFTVTLKPGVGPQIVSMDYN